MYVSLKDVAARAGVSFQTASKVLNGRERVASPQTVKRIHAAAQELGYVPNLLARGLVRRNSITVGILVDDLADGALSLLIAGAQHALAAGGHATLMTVMRPEVDAARTVRTLLERRVDGVLVIAPSLEEDRTFSLAVRDGLPVVSINRLPGTSAVMLGSDHRTTGSLAAEHLVELGHRVIATVTGPPKRDVVRRRLAGFRKVLDDAGIDLPDSRVAAADWSADGAYLATARLLERDPQPTAFFVHSDVMAMGALRLLADRDIHVPDDASVVGCDDLPLSRFLVPSLTTVHVPLVETGTRAAGALLEKINGTDVPPRELLPVHLVERASTRRHRARLNAAPRARAPAARRRAMTARTRHATLAASVFLSARRAFCT